MVLPKNAHQKIKHFFSKIVGILFHLSPSPMFTAALNSFSKDGGGKKISKERKKRGFLATPAVFSYSNNKTCKTRNSNSSSNSNNSNNSSNSSKKGVVRLYNATRYIYIYVGVSALRLYLLQLQLCPPGGELEDGGDCHEAGEVNFKISFLFSIFWSSWVLNFCVHHPFWDP